MSDEKTAKEKGLPGTDVSIAPNYRDNCVWLEMPGMPRTCISPERARAIANGIEANFNIEEIVDQGYPTDELVADLRSLADDVEADDE